MDSPPSAAAAKGRDPLALVRSLSQRYLLVLAAVASLVVVDQAVIQPQLVRLNFYAPAINVAGRQRMLSQKVTKEALALAGAPRGADNDARRTALQTALTQWAAAHRGLLDGDAALGLEPISNPNTRAALRSVELPMRAIQQAAEEIASVTASQPTPQVNSTLATILDNEPEFLRGMEGVVGILEHSARNQVAWLRWCGMAAMSLVLLLLAGVYFSVLHPAIRLIRGQIAQLAGSEQRHRDLAVELAAARDELESRVATRTSELVAANRTLEHEIAERESAERRMRELSGALAHASRVTALGQLATGLAHEINQPLGAIAAYADVLELSADEGHGTLAEARSTIQKLKQAALRAGQIVRRMRNFVRPTSEPATAVELNALVREVCDLCRPQLDQSQIQLRTELTSHSTVVLADSLEIQQVLVNLVQNATQAMAACPRTQRILRLRSRVDEVGAVVEVIDQGPGFPTTLAEESFEPFFSTKSDGLGMGLAICRSILDRHQGRLWGENLAQGGALVGFCLPTATNHEIDARANAHCVCR